MSQEVYLGKYLRSDGQVWRVYPSYGATECEFKAATRTEARDWVRARQPKRDSEEFYKGYHLSKLSGGWKVQGRRGLVSTREEARALVRTSLGLVKEVAI